MSSMDVDVTVIRIFNAVGQELPFERHGKEIRLSALANGVYYVTFQQGDEFVTQKLLVNF